MTHYIENIQFTGKLRGERPGIKIPARMAGFSELSHYLVGSDSLTDLVRKAVYFISDLVNVRICRIYLVDQNGRWFQPAAEDAQLHLFRSSENGTSCDPTLTNLFESVLKLENTLDGWNRELSLVESNALGVSPDSRHWLIPLVVENKNLGVLFLSQPVNMMHDPFTPDARYVVDLVTDQLSNAIHRNQLNERLSNLSIETVLALSRTLDARDSHSGSHSKRMAVLSEQMAIKYKMTSRETRELSWAALLHDIGKIGVEDQILYKPGPLSEREWAIMKTHADVGAQMVQGISGMENISALILSHHERMDGSGYPRGLAGEQIPFGARIIAVVDSYSAMTEGRSYRKAKTHDEAIEEIKSLSGYKYDSDVVHTFISLFEVSYAGFIL